MSTGGSDRRERILGAVRRSLGRGRLEGEAAAELEARLERPTANLIPARVRREPAKLVELFAVMAEEAAATVVRVASPDGVPAAVAAYLSERNLPARATLAPDPQLDDVPWGDERLLALHRGKAEDSDAVAITGAFAGIAETGTLMLLSGPEHPSTLNLLPDTHIVVLRRAQVVASYEEAWARLRASGRDMPRTVNFVTGPSRTADIEQTIQLGAHGPRRLHVVLVDGPLDGGAGGGRRG